METAVESFLPTVAPADVLPPTPEVVDQIITDYELAMASARQYKEEADEVKERLLLLVSIFGQAPAGATQSKRLLGRRNEATITYSTLLLVNEDAVGDFKNYLDKEGYYSLIPRFFSAETRHHVVDGARDVLKTIDVPKRIADKILAYFGRAIEVKTKAPSLSVKAIQPEKPARKPRDGKAAA